MLDKTVAPSVDERDAALVVKAVDGSGEAFDLLAQRMMPMMSRLAARYRNLPGMDAEDLLQEGLLALVAAVHAYQPALGAFHAFAASCVRNRMLSVVRRYLPEGYVQVSQSEEDMVSIADSGQVDPAVVVVEKEEAGRLYRRLRERLSALEYKVLTAHLTGRTYSEIAAMFAISQKAVDNALQRVRKKLSENAP